MAVATVCTGLHRSRLHCGGREGRRRERERERERRGKVRRRRERERGQRLRESEKEREKEGWNYFFFRQTTLSEDCPRGTCMYEPDKTS